MSFFTFDKSKAKESFELVEEGVYEAVIVNAVAGKTRNGDDKLTLDYEIRSDYQQKFQGAKILYNTYTFKNEVAVNILTNLLNACGFGDKVAFESPEDMANQLMGKTLQIGVRHETYKNNEGQERKAAKAKFYNPSKIEAPKNETPQVSAGDLPF